MARWRASTRLGQCSVKDLESGVRIRFFSGMFGRSILIFWLFASLVGPFRLTAHTAPRIALPGPLSRHVGAAARPPRKLANAPQRVVEKVVVSRTRRRRRPHAAARAVERRLLIVASRTRLLARFVDRSTGLVKRNVAAHCKLIRRGHQRRHRHRRSVYLCQVWQQPHPPASGVKVNVLCPTEHKRFVVVAYRRP